jgi:Protein of unknown function (DUF3040)
VALPMDEQRILDEMERMLAADDPRLAARLASFGQPGLGQALRTRRGRVTLSLMMLALIAAVSMVLYMMSAFRLSGARQGGPFRHDVARTSSPASPQATRLPRSAERRMVQLVSPGCAAIMAPRVCITVWLLAAARHK